MIRQVGTFFRRDLFVELGGVDEELDIAMDTELLIRFTQHHAPLVLDEHLAAYRNHEGAKTQRVFLPIYEEADRVRKRYLSTLSDDRLLNRYRRRCSNRWRRFSRSNDITMSIRLVCLKKAVVERIHAWMES